MGTNKNNFFSLKNQNTPFPQKPLWKETFEILGKVESSAILNNSKAIAKFLLFNSEETRARYGRALVTRFSRLEHQILDGLIDIINSKLEFSITEKVWRVLFCQIEPIVAQIYKELIWPREPGSTIDRNEIMSYIETAFEQESTELNRRIVDCLRQAGFITSQNKESFYIVGFGDLKDALIISTHLLYARKPRTLKILDVKASHYWKYLGYRKFEHVRFDFRSAESKGLLMRYATVDHLEQITTRYHWSEILLKIISTQ